MRGLGPNEHLIGTENCRQHLMTPVLLIDLDAFENNIRTMSRHFADRPEGLRPHAKTHKCAEIARQQLDAGAVGICVAKLGEAVALAEQGIGNILITSPVVTPAKIDWMLDLNDQMDELIVVVDHPQTVDQISRRAARRSKNMQVLVDLGIGTNRTGVASIPAAVGLAERVRDASSMVLRGMQCYAGHVQGMETCEEREAEARGIMRFIGQARDAIESRTGKLDIVSGGGTGTYDIDPEAGVFTDLQVGSYIFMDVLYNSVQRRDGTKGPFQTSLFVQSTVICANVDGAVTTDGGIKAFAMDGPLPVITDGAPPESVYDFMGDEHGRVILPEGTNGPALGDTITCVTPHCDPTVNLHDFFHCVRGDTLEAIWRIDSRGQTW